MFSNFFSLNLCGCDRGILFAVPPRGDRLKSESEQVVKTFHFEFYFQDKVLVLNNLNLQKDLHAARTAGPNIQLGSETGDNRHHSIKSIYHQIHLHKEQVVLF